jgi:hypothetical protein
LAKLANRSAQSHLVETEWLSWPVNARVAAVPDRREASANGSSGAGLSLPDWRDLDSVAGWICRYLPPDEARVVARTVLSRVEELEHRSGTAAR